MILKADRIITGDGATVLDNGAVHIENGRITDIGNLDGLKSKYFDDDVQEYNNASILPGLIDMHVHMGYWWSKPDAKYYNDFRTAFFAAHCAKKALSKGVTTLRDVSSPKNLCVSINAAVNSGYLEAPRIITTDAALNFTGGHSWEVGGIEVNGPWEIRAAIRDNIKRGATWIKLMASHRSNTPEFTQEELDTAVDECHRVGKKAAVHAGTQPSIQMCIDAGFDTIEHGTYMTVEQARQMAQKSLVWVPTIVAYTRTYEYILEMMKSDGAQDSVGSKLTAHSGYFRDAAMAYKENFKKLYETGVKIVVGTDMVFNDAPVTPVNLEMKYMADYGMPAIEVIQAATKNAAETLSIDDIGEIALGKIADITVVKGNPAEDITAIENVTAVYQNGKTVYKD